MECEKKQCFPNADSCDLLDRQCFVDKLLIVSKMLANSKKNACYAIDGEWGVGKTFVLNLFEEQIQNIPLEDSTLNKFLLFHYNCWQYDYYEEPLIAIVSAMLDALEENVQLLPEHTKVKIKGILRAVAGSLFIQASQVLEKQTGFNIDKIKEVIEESKDDAAKELAQDHAFDPYFNFKKILIKLKETVASLAKDQTVIFVVDELDRCLPEYTIKVLERLHHVFEGISNVQVILSIDKSQLSHVVRQIYGNNTSSEKYLAKFINFEIKLDAGRVNHQFDQKFSYYVQSFSLINKSTRLEDLNELKRKIFDGIDMRRRIDIIDKCHLLHGILNDSEEPKDCVFMCIELFLAVLMHWKIDVNEMANAFSIDNVFGLESQELGYCGLNVFSDKYRSSHGNSRYYIRCEDTDCITRNDIWGAVLASYRYIMGFVRDTLLDDSYSGCNLRAYAFDFWNLLKTIN